MYLRGIETKFNIDERNYDSALGDEDSELFVFFKESSSLRKREIH